MQLSGAGLIELRSATYRARVAPAAGGRLAALAWTGGTAPLPLLVEWDGQAFDQHHWPKAGAFPMLPFANRLPGREFGFGHRTARLQPGPDGVALHGFAHRRPWTVLGASADRVRMRYEHEGAHEGWPWAWSAEQDVSLGAAGITVRLAVRNDGADTMPLGLGWHPYLRATGNLSPRDLQIEAAHGSELGPDGAAQEQRGTPAFGMQRGETAAWSGWTGLARLQLAGGAATVVTCSGAPHVVLHRPRVGDYVCVEPVTVLPGLLGRDLPGAAGVLAPGASQELCWTCGLEPVA